MTSTESVKKTRLKKKALIEQYRNERGCVECGEKHPATLDLHHRNSDEKCDHLRRRTQRQNRGRGWTDMSFASIEAELAKCDVLCSNCHRILEAAKRAADIR